LLTRPAMLVVQVDDDGREDEPLLAALHRATADGALQHVEEPLQVLRRMRAFHVCRQPIHALVGGAERTGGTLALEVVAVRLFRSPLRTRADERRQLSFAVMLALGH